MATDQAVEDDKDQQGWQDYKPSGDGWSDYAPPQGDISSEASMAAHPPVPKLASNPSHVAGTQTGLTPQMQPAPTTASLRTQLKSSGALPNSHPSNVLSSFNQQTGQHETPEQHNKYLGPAVGTGMTVGMAGIPLAEGIMANGLRAGLINAGKPIVKSIVGAGAGHYLGREAGGTFGPTGAKIGGEIGGLAGGLYGGAGGKIPTKAEVMSLFEEPPAPEFPGAHLPDTSEFYSNRGADFMRALKQQPEAFAGPAAPEFPGAHLPAAEDFYANRGAEINRAMRQQPDAFPSSERPFFGPDTPNEAQFRRSARMGADNAAAVASPEIPRATVPDVSVIPEPRELFPNEKTGYNQSTPRRLLLGNAEAGRPGAGEAIRNAGGTVIYAPKGAGISNVKSVVAAPGELHGNPTPFGSRMTLNPVAAPGSREIEPGNEFESLFGPEHQEVGDLAEWETGNREGFNEDARRRRRLVSK